MEAIVCEGYFDWLSFAHAVARRCLLSKSLAGRSPDFPIRSL